MLTSAVESSIELETDLSLQRWGCHHLLPLSQVVFLRKVQVDTTFIQPASSEMFIEILMTMIGVKALAMTVGVIELNHD